MNAGVLRLLTIAAVSLLFWCTASAATTAQPSKSSSTSHKSSKSSKSGKKTGSKSGKKSAKSSAHGQHTIDPERTTQIQEALIREHYLNGEPTGKWDPSTKDALAKYQEANGWQTKSLPDSRALIKLGLGPDKKGLLNPDTAVVTSPHELGLTHDTQPGGSAQQ
jgi:peptidoglycan hydrolase-like protein with peptidoglycan-binding domain